ncbi:hypothetical protein [Bowmanella dokdonensis]|uniref:Uncharacterized protein n=1 Tax=Bowmanella dokdonensis TaxID=751969 RepID=A0A939DJA5_9ALTE|nr:hypothetical protein [Bowmanella dokdonensis]MBN7823759.1 hypothetical protein [Bowmanella dokdonensis]
MKKLVLGSLLVMTTLSSTGAMASVGQQEEQSRYVFSGDLAFADFCKSALRDDVSLLRRTVFQQVGRLAPSENGVYRSLFQPQSLTCAGQSLMEFSQSRKAESVYQYLKEKADKL